MKEQLEKEIRKLEADIKTLQIKEANLKQGNHSLERKKDVIGSEIAETENKKLLILSELSKTNAQLNEIKKELHNIESNNEAEEKRLKQEWMNLKEEATALSNKESKLLEDDKQLKIEFVKIKENGKKIISQLEDMEAQKKQLQETANKNIADTNYNKKIAEANKGEATRLLAEKDQREVEEKNNKILEKILKEQLSDIESKRRVLDLSIEESKQNKKDTEGKLKEVAKLSEELNGRIADAERVKTKLNKEIDDLQIKKDENEIRRLQLIKATKEEDTKKRLKILEEELAPKDSK